MIPEMDAGRLRPPLQRRADDHRGDDRPADPAEQHHDRLRGRRRQRLGGRHVRRGPAAGRAGRAGDPRRLRRPSRGWPGARVRSTGTAVGPRIDARRIVATGMRAAPGLLLVVLVLVGILRGWFSATEASAIAVLYAFLLAVVFYRTVRLRRPAGDPPARRHDDRRGVPADRHQPGDELDADVPARPRRPSARRCSTPRPARIVVLLIMNAILLVVGAVMDMTPAVLIFTPIFLPVAAGLGVDPVHFGVILVANLCIGLCTPPVGTCLFVGCTVGRIGIAEVVRPMIPFLLAMVAALVVDHLLAGRRPLAARRARPELSASRATRP